MTKDEEGRLGSCEGDVHSSRVLQETDAGRQTACPDARQDDDVLLLTLETVDCVKVDCRGDVPTVPGREDADEFSLLLLVHGDDSDSVVEIDGRELHLEVLIDGESSVGFCGVLERVADTTSGLSTSVDVEEAVGSKGGGGVPGLKRLGRHVGTISQLAVVENSTG